ncbi:bifunctional metallophosphatase/5'-nucleotidase [Streptomyces anulatus]|uniref:bifunctional metallophosphatase/5'-nucleotidase n=1 Tax=Streptomyces anulatus TaxID=1892 RepID=UPI001C26FD9A|nr:bifunctional metallophosphatase/5'-nucleotidase [Streptomyces anulatus]
MSRTYGQIVATTDLHSALDQANRLLPHLHDLKETSLIADCGDFFEGTGYYRLGKGAIGREILTTLYDVLAPGNHGWPHYFEPGLREMTICVDSWIVLSHSGFDEDLRLAGACPFVDVVFAGHCHSDTYGPVHVGDTLVVKGRELADGYAAAEPVGSCWAARTAVFPAPATIPDELTTLDEKIASICRMLATRLGTVNEPYRDTVLDRHQLLRDVAFRLHTGLSADAVILNDTALRPIHLGDVLRLGDLLAIEPFANQLVHAFLPDRHAQAPDGLLTHLTGQTGPLAVSPGPLPPGIRSVLTTDYLADTYLGGRTHQASLRLGETVRRVIATPLPEKEEGDR